MEKCKAIYILVFLILAVMISFANLDAVERSVIISIDTDKQIYEPYEPVAVTTTAFNPTAESFTMAFECYPYINYLINDEFDYFRDNWNNMCLHVYIQITLEPWQEISWIYVHQPGFFFLAPGTHKITGIIGRSIIYGSDETMISVTTTSNSDNDLLPPEDSGIQIRNYPNPFNPDTHISFQLPKEGRVSLTVFDARGKLVRTLADKSFPKGSHTVLWNGSDEQGREISSGVYYYRLIHQNEEITGKMLLLK
jgi:hypothetical protein